MRHRRLSGIHVLVAIWALATGIGAAFVFPPEYFAPPALTPSVDAKPMAAPTFTAADAEAACDGANDGKEQRKCFREFLGNVTAEEGPESAFTVLKPLYDRNAIAKGFCHQLAHEIGHAGYALYHEVGAAFLHGDAFCWSGYHHGVMESYVADVGYDRLPSVMNDICASMPGRERYSFDYYNCVHGIGHGLMAVTGDDLRASLALCDGLKGGWERHSCYGGVFMQNTINEDFGEHGSDFRADDPAYPCDDIGAKYKEACYLTQTSHMLAVLGRDFTKVFAACAAIPDKDYLDTCYRSIGRDASGSTVSNVAKTRDICLLGKDVRAREGCVIGATKDFISFFHSDAQAKELCAAFDDARLEDACMKTAGEYYASFR